MKDIFGEKVKRKDGSEGKVVSAPAAAASAAHAPRTPTQRHHQHRGRR